MRKFDYYAPDTLKEAIAILRQNGPGGQVLAGGTDLLVQIKEHIKGMAPKYLVSLKNLDELKVLRRNGARGLRIGARVTMSEVVESALVQKGYPIIVDGARLIGSMQIRNLATVGGNLCNAAPSADMAPPLIALGAKAISVGTRGRRTVALEDFFVGPGKTVLKPDEILVEIDVPRPPARSGGAYLRHTPRQYMDIAVVGVGSFVVLDAKGRCKDARIVLGAVAPTPIRAAKAEATLVGKVLDDEAIADAAEIATTEARPISDVRGSAEYRRYMVGVLTRKTLRMAVERARR